MNPDKHHKEECGQPQWGLLPDNVIASLRRKAWGNTKNLKNRLKGDQPFPIQISLKPPRGNTVLEDINHFQLFISSWKAFSVDVGNHSCEVCWEHRGYRHLSEQMVPTKFVIRDIGALARVLGKSEERRLHEWQSKISYVLTSLAVGKEKEKAVFVALIDHLEALSKFDDSDLALFVRLIPQLKSGMGKGCYLRSLPVTYVDTKFIENNIRTIESITAAAIDETVKQGGLLSWLKCKDKPKDWLLVKPLCEQTKAALGGIPLLRLASDTLLGYELPANNILIVENEQSCLALPEIAKTIAIAGGGKNVSWMKATWLTAKRVGYWGDIDLEGLNILSDARSRLGSLTPLMMDVKTVQAYQDRMVKAPDSVPKKPIALTQDELDLFRALQAKKYQYARLEQERLPMDYVEKVINSWLE